MSYVCNAVTILVLTLLAVSPAWAQSLGDVARKEEARRKTVKATGKVYTNDTLRKEPEAAPPSTPAPPPSSAPAVAAPVPSGSQGQAQSRGGEAQPPAAPQPEQKKKDEAYWRGRITEARQNLARAEVFHDALQSRINALTTDFVARDDPAQRRVIEADRLKALAELDRVTKEIAQFKKAIADIEEEARRAAVPPGWLR
jgi:hypothetical protein